MKRITGAFNVEEPSYSDIDDLVSAVDIDGDGRITEEEFNELVRDIVNIIREEIQFEKLKKNAWFLISFVIGLKPAKKYLSVLSIVF